MTGYNCAMCCFHPNESSHGSLVVWGWVNSYLSLISSCYFIILIILYTRRPFPLQDKTKFKDIQYQNFRKYDADYLCLRLWFSDCWLLTEKQRKTIILSEYVKKQKTGTHAISFTNRWFRRPNNNWAKTMSLTIFFW